MAYASIAITVIDHSVAPKSLSKRPPDPLPALLLGRLAVDRGHAGKGIGRALVAHVLASAIALNRSAACHAIVVSAQSSRAQSWWELLGFHPFDLENQSNPDLFILTNKIEKTLRDK